MTRVIVAAYHPLVVKGISEAISEKLPESRIVATATSARAFLSIMNTHKPEVAVVDVSITWKSEIDLVDEIYNISPDIKLHFVSTHPFDHSVQKYLVKKVDKTFKSQVKDNNENLYQNSESALQVAKTKNTSRI